MNEAPTLVNRHFPDQPMYRTTAAPGLAFPDLAHLLGDMDVKGLTPVHRNQFSQLVGSNGA
jgi:hypothetical protein